MKYNLTLEEKLKLLSGKNCWETEDFNGKIPSVLVADGPCGVRKFDENMVKQKSVAYPTPSLIACSWDEDLAKQVASRMADECIERGIDVLLMPGVNIKRSPLCGRNFEYLSEDPYLAGTLARGYINGLQEKHIGTSLKHFAVNNYETYRWEQNVELDDRVLFDLYLRAFKIAIEGSNPYTVMCSYNLVNGAYASENPRLLNDILRKKFGFEGVIVSDWGAVKNRAKSLKATLDLAMPYEGVPYEELMAAYEQGYITIEEIDASVERILNLIEKVMFDRENRQSQTTAEQRHEFAISSAKESIVLLKNDGVLPLSTDTKIDLIDKSMRSSSIGGGGSSLIDPQFPVKTLSEALAEYGVDAPAHACFDADLYSDYRIVCVGTSKEDETEGRDRPNLEMGVTNIDETSILDAINMADNVIVVIYAGSVVDCSKWIDKVKAVIYAGYGGEGINQAVASVIFGKTNPSGKLAESWALTHAHYPVDITKEQELVVTYTEKFNVGYRFFDKHPENVLFPFGFGLSYSKFEYSNLKINKLSETDYEVSYDVTNTSTVAGKEVSQLYIGMRGSRFDKPVKELKGYDKVYLKGGETKTITVKLDKTAFESYNWVTQDYYVENGKYDIYIGASSTDVRLKQSVIINEDMRYKYSTDKVGQFKKLFAK